MKNIYLIGFMGSGKSSVGRCLSVTLNCNYVDTDAAVEAKYNKTIATIFSEEGESAFRSYESVELREIPYNNCVVSTGGGIIKNHNNVEQMKDTGIIVYLATSFEKIDNRLKTDLSRPLWNQNKQKQKQLFEERLDLYRSCADITVLTDDKSLDDIVAEVRSYIVSE
ncbi:shikimate kinase [Virgibacillus necropolis]|uniref:shikimate kinase n=1 Tax=Virgibacillus necropolis TaxID=163877 RepID=UPI00384EB838